MKRRKKAAPTKTRASAKKPAKRSKVAASAKRAAPKPTAAKVAVKRIGKSLPRPAMAPKLITSIAPFVEELEVALGELRRLSTELVATRRQIVEDQSVGYGMASSMKQQVEAIRTELKTARADLEIAQANTRRSETRLEAAAEAEARARESQREAEHAADRGRDEILWLRREVDGRVTVGPKPPHTDEE